jgi:NDP-sugar pyrophosphorylase family protein
MLNIVIPMAGHGSRFQNVGISTPKPLISVNNKFMIEGVMDNLQPQCEHRFIFICQEEHLKNYPLEEKLLSKNSDSLIIPINEYTEGAACTVLTAKDYINNLDQLMIANSDQWIDFNINSYLYEISSKNLDGLIMTMKASNPKWSYVKLDDNNFVTEAVEKVVVSDEATVGIYNFTRGKDFCTAAEQMISLGKRVNGEFYVAPVYNELFDKDFKVGIYNIGSVGDGMYGLGTPEDLDDFKSNQICIKF